MGLTLSEVHTRVRSLLNDQGQQVFQSPEITQFSNDWMREVAATYNCFQKAGSFATVAGTRTYSMATDFIDIGMVSYNYTRWLSEITWNELAARTNDPTTQGTPDTYYFERTPGGTSSQVSTVMGLYPVPSEASQVKYFYYYSPTALVNWTDRIPLPDGNDESAVYYVCEKMKLKDREFGEAEKFRVLKDVEFKRLASTLTSSPNLHRRMGSDRGGGTVLWPGLNRSKFSIP